MIDYVLKINARNYSVQYKIQSVEISIELGKLVIPRPHYVSKCINFTL